jgi:hypothetical protein
MTNDDSFPSPIPSQVTVPNWAYADVTVRMLFLHVSDSRKF